MARRGESHPHAVTPQVHDAYCLSYIFLDVMRVAVPVGKRSAPEVRETYTAISFLCQQWEALETSDQEVGDNLVRAVEQILSDVQERKDSEGVLEGLVSLFSGNPITVDLDTTAALLAENGLLHFSQFRTRLSNEDRPSLQ